MKKFFRETVEIGQMVFVATSTLFLFFVVGKLVLEPLAPIITTLTVAVFTYLTFRVHLNTILSVGGIILYAASWPAVWTWGVWPGMLVWAIGVFAWFAAVLRTFSYSPTAPAIAR